MQQFIMDLLERLNKSHVIKPLIKNESFIMLLTCNQEKYCIELKEVRFDLLKSNPVKPDILMEGSESCLQSIFLGEVLLRELKKEKSLTITTTIRKLLMLESLFYLVNIKNTVHKKL
ncbi:hypothetical protein [Niallia sp. 01092]|uniref:hypothetical protein n=1 Tax=unclassified Niallia TaxID=2837522 RepID=UPI003FD05C26